MIGRKISRAEFKRNYVNVNPKDVNKPIKPEPEPEHIYNPVTLRYDAICGMTDKGICIQFEKDGEEYWFPRSLIRINKRTKQITLPKKFVESKDILDSITDDDEPKAQTLTEFFDRQKG